MQLLTTWQQILAVVLLISTVSTLRSQTTIEQFIFGHSLIHHEYVTIATPSDETKIPHWIYLLAQEAGHTYAAGGKYGFLPQHANVTPFSQWGYDIVPGVWDEDVETFAQTDISSIMITAGNFMQWQGPDQDYPTDPGITPISATETVLDWCNTQKPGLTYYIYENWPDMAPYLDGGTIPATQQEFTNYNIYTQGAFNDWWLQYHDAILASRPQYNVRMIPVGPIISKLLEEEYPNQIPFADLYEDNAPHGRPTIYFLAGLVTYMAIYQEQAPASYTVPPIVHTVVGNNYIDIVNFIWTELQAFNTNSGASRVFFSTLPVVIESFEGEVEEESIVLTWQVAEEQNVSHYEIERGTGNGTFTYIGEVSSSAATMYTYTDSAPHLGSNYYRLKVVDNDGSYAYSTIVQLDFDQVNSVFVYPNPSTDVLHLTEDLVGIIQIVDMSGKIVSVQKGMIQSVDISDLPQGVYTVCLWSDNLYLTQRIIKP